MQIVAALVWPAVAFVFAFAFAGLWLAERARWHLLGFAAGFLALFITMTSVIAFPAFVNAYMMGPIHFLACTSVIAFVWGATARLNQKIPLVAMCAVTLVSTALFLFALGYGEDRVALLAQNGSSAILFGIGAVTLWMARSVNVFDRLLVWTFILLGGFTLMRPLYLFYLDAQFGPIFMHKTQFDAANVVILTVLTAVLGLVLLVMAIQDASEIKHRSERSDPVSGFLDQRTFESVGESAYSKSQRLNMPITMVVLQLDWFEQIMEKWGTDTSDMVLREISDVIRSWQRDSDVIGRVGEDRFAILFVGVGANSAQKITYNLRQDIDAACNDRMSGVLKFTLSSSIHEATSGMSFKGVLKGALAPLVRSRALGSNISFLNGAQMQQSMFTAARDGTFVSHG